MKKSLLLMALSIAIGLHSKAENVLTGRAAYEVVKGAEKVRIKDFSRVPAHIKFYESERIAFSNWQEWMKNSFFKEKSSIGF